jgi:hypothetical protein
MPKVQSVHGRHCICHQVRAMTNGHHVSLLVCALWGPIGLAPWIGSPLSWRAGGRTMTDATHFYSLIVKGAQEYPDERLGALDLAVWDTVSTGTETIVRVMSESDLTNALNEWMGEDVGDPPFPDGALLYWRELDHL